MKKITIAISLLLASHAMQAQPSRSPLNAPYTAVVVYSKNFSDPFAGSINPAALAQAKQAGAGVYTDRMFMLKDLSNFAAAIVLPVKWGGFGLAARYFGGPHFNTAQLGIGYGKKLGDKADAGIQFNYNTIQLAGYGSAGVITVEAGTLLHISNQLHLGLHIYNPLGGKFGTLNNEQLASVYTAGLGYDVSAVFFVSAACSKETDQPINISASMQYAVSKRLFLRLGISGSIASYFFGLGTGWKNYRIDIISSWKAPLGFTPGIMLLVNFGTQPKQPEE